MNVVIVGAGIGGLACAIACRREGLEVVVLERSPVILQLGAGIQVPPNAALLAKHLGYLDKLLEHSVALDAIELLRYADGRLLHTRWGDKMLKKYGVPWLLIHRADYHQVLWKECQSLGVDLRLGAEVVTFDFEGPAVVLRNGEVVRGDVVVGADGLWSTARDQLLGAPSPPQPTGDLAYRGTFTIHQLRSLNDPRVDALCARKVATVWLGPDRHSVFYPVRQGRQFNLVLLRPDDMAPDERRVEGDIEEMRASFAGWDDVLTKIISTVPSVLKWKLCHHKELETWTKDSVVLLGDACHPTLPYQAQGAAMAVEDGAMLGKLLGLLEAECCSSSTSASATRRLIPSLLETFTSARKSRTTVNVQGAQANQKWYHVPDGPLQEARDAELTGVPLGGGRGGETLQPTGWNYLTEEYETQLYGFDGVKDALEVFAKWRAERENGAASAVL